MDASRVDAIRRLMNDEHRTHDQLDSVVEELLDQIVALTSAARSAAVLVRSAADSGRPIEPEVLRIAARTLDEIADRD